MTDPENSMTPMSYLKIFFRRKELFIIPMIIGLVLGVCVSKLLPKSYLSSTVLMVEEGKTDNPLFKEIAVSTTVDQRLATIKESMLGWNSLIKLVKRLHMDTDVRDSRGLEALILGIREKIVIKMQGQNIINLSYIGSDPEQTQAVVKTITDIFTERNLDIQNKETADAIVFIEEQLKVYKGKIKSGEIAKLRDDLKELLTDSTEEHPKVKQLREQLNIKEAELKKENLQYTEGITLDSKSTNPLILEIKSALDNLDGGIAAPVTPETPESDLYKVMLMDKLDNVMARDVDVNTKIYNMLLNRLETAKITQRLQASKEGTKYTILDPPRVPLDPVSPNVLLVTLGGLVLGGLVGFGLVISFEFLDKSFLDVEEAKQFLGTPLLGAISKINTEESLQKEKERLGWIYGMTLVAGAVMFIVTTAISNFMQK